MSEDFGKIADMPLANCSHCHRLFNRGMHDLCPACREAEDEVYHRLSDYLSREPSATAAQAAEATGVDPEVIRRMVRSGRLAGFDALAMSVLACQRCAAPIPTGRFCVPCQRKLRAGLAPSR